MTEFTYKGQKFTSQKHAEMAVKALFAKRKDVAKAWVKNGSESMRKNFVMTPDQNAKWKAVRPGFITEIAIARAIANENYRKQLAKTKNANLQNARTNILRRFPPKANSSPRNQVAPLPAPVSIKVKEAVCNSAACIRISKMPLKDHQIRVAKAIRKQRGLVVVHSVGSGKTLTAVTASQVFLRDHPSAKVFVLTPLTLIDNFKKAMTGYGLKNNDDRYIIISHETFLSRYKKAIQTKTPVTRDGFTITTDPFKGNMVIIDEAHRFRTQPLIVKNKGGQAYNTDARWMIRASRGAERVLCLTATPFVNAENDLWNLVSMVKGKDFQNSNKSQWGGLFSFYERDHKDPNFPRVNMYDQKIKMSKTFYKVYEDIFEATREKFPPKMNISSSEAFLLKMRQAVGGYMKKAENPKSEWIIQKVIEVLEKKGRVFIYASFIDTGIGRVEEQLKKFGIKFNAIHGDVPRTERTRVINEYNTGQTPVLLITQAGGVGIDLKETSDIILFDNVWNPANESQIIGRGVRFGSHMQLPPEKRVVNVHRLILDLPAGHDPRVFSADVVMTQSFIEPKRVKMEKVLNDIRVKYSIESSKK